MGARCPDDILNPRRVIHRPLLLVLVAAVATGCTTSTPERNVASQPPGTGPNPSPATQGKTVDSLTVDVSAPDAVGLGEPVRVRVRLTNATTRTLTVTIYGDKLYWLYFVRSPEGWIRYAGGNETPVEKSQLRLKPAESQSLVLQWQQNLTCCGGGQARPGLYYLEVLPLIGAPMDYRVTRPLVIRSPR